MRDFILMTLIRLRRSEEGVTLVEYGIALVLAVLVGTTALGALATAVEGNMDDATAIIAPVVP
jgi:pilus assembly protein Flp/PilA